MTKRQPIAVIGGGLGGLASACTLAARGHAVLLFEKNAWLGGKAAVLQAGGFRFDMGPTILTMPDVLSRIFGEAGRDMHEAQHLDRPVDRLASADVLVHAQHLGYLVANRIDRV